MLGSVERRAKLKGKGVPFVIGLALSFGTLTFLNFLRNLIRVMLQ